MINNNVSPTSSLSHRFTTFCISASTNEARQVLIDLLGRHSPSGSTVVDTGDSFHIRDAAGNTRVEIVLQEGEASSTTILPFIYPPLPATQLLMLSRGKLDNEDLAKDIYLIDVYKAVVEACDKFADREVSAIVRSMPLLMEFSQGWPNAMSDWALVWRDHFLEENVALLYAFERCGVDPKWIFALAKGDQTVKRHRIGAYFRSRGYETEVLDNAVFFDYNAEKTELSRVTPQLERFVAQARQAGKRVALLDDGAIVPRCFKERQGVFDFAVELTIPGIKRLEEVGHIDVPVYDLAHSQLKTVITYPEIAASCVIRIRELLAAEKFIGRSVIVTGYGTAGHHIARILRAMGCGVSVVDTSAIRLIEAAEGGFATFRTVSEAIQYTQPFLVIGCAGDASIGQADYALLPDGCYVTGIATKDLSVLKMEPFVSQRKNIPHFGYEHVNTSGSKFYQLGDGRSINLFESEAIPNRGNDVFKAAILVVTKSLCLGKIDPPGIHTAVVDSMIEKSGLLDRYYDLYFAHKEDNL